MNPARRASAKPTTHFTCVRALLALAMAAGLSVSVPVQADDARALLYNYSATASAFVEGGATDYSAFRSGYGIAPRGVGVRYTERNGIITGTLGALVMVLVSSVGSVGTVKSSRTWEDSSYKYSETTYYSEAEKDERRERASRIGGNGAGAAVGSRTQGFDLMLYSRNLGGDATGFLAKLMMFSLFDSDRARLDVGLIFGSISTATSRDGSSLLTHASTGGMPFRYNLAVGPVLTYAEFDWNWYGHGTPAADVRANNTLAQDVRNMPWHLGASAALFHRLYLEAALTTPRLLSGELGFNSSLGARF